MRRLIPMLALMTLAAFAICPASAQSTHGNPGGASAERQPVINYRLTVHPSGQPPLSLYVEEMGHGPTLLLLHGIGGSSYTWRSIAPVLAARHRVIAIDLRGFGRSAKPFDLAYSPLDHAEVVRAFLDERRLSRVTLVGHSYGGLVTLLLAMDRRLGQHRISRIVVIDTPAYPQQFSPGVEFLRRPLLPYLALHVLPPELPIALALMMERMGLERLDQRDVAVYADPLSEPGGPHALIETARQIVPPGFDRLIRQYRTITKPALVLTCRDDQVVPVATARLLARALPGARLTVLEGCDHVPPEQAPDAVIEAMRGFLAR